MLKLIDALKKRIIVKTNFYDVIKERARLYSEVYKYEPRKSAFRMMVLSFLAFILGSEQQESIAENDPVLNVGFRIGGGFGDYIMFANYLYYLSNEYFKENVTVDIYFTSGFSNAKYIFRENELCHKCYKHDETGYCEKYDVFIELSRFPKIIRNDMNKVAALIPEFAKYLLAVEKFEYQNPRYFSYAGADGQSAVFSKYYGQKRLQQADIYGLLGITEEYKYPMFIDGNEDEFLRSVSLEQKKYVTLHRGCDVQYARHVKMWPLEYYEELVRLIKKDYPELILVQYGVDEKRCPPIKGVDKNLVGTTSMDQVKILLKNSLLHIDSDGGMIHLRHALHGGKSIAFYGPNWEDFFGYSENINITGPACNEFCDWMTDDWMLNCARGFEEPPCLKSISPNYVKEKFDDFMKEVSI